MRIFLIVTVAMLLAMLSPPAFAQSEDSEVTVTVDEVLQVEYTGSQDLEFGLTEDDIGEGWLDLIDQGDIHWLANICPWKITVERTDWAPPSDFSLLVKFDPEGGDEGDWTLIGTTPTDWILGGDCGTGAFGGVDWRVTGFDSETSPGLYICTVTVTIVSSE